MGISYDSDVDLAMKIMKEESKNHPNCIDNRNKIEIDNGKDQITTRLINFGDSSVNIRAYVWSTDPITGFEMKTDLFKSIKKRFDAEGIEIPFPHRTLVYKNEKKA
jgi:small-conductance mechanosensitive channel